MTITVKFPVPAPAVIPPDAPAVSPSFFWPPLQHIVFKKDT